MIRLITANSWSPWMVPPHRLSLPKRVRYYYATRRNSWYCVWVTIPSSHLERVMTSPEVERSKFLVPGVGNDPTSVPYQDTANPSQLTRHNSLRNTRRSHSPWFELLFSFSSFRRQFIPHPTGPTTLPFRHCTLLILSQRTVKTSPLRLLLGFRLRLS